MEAELVTKQKIYIKAQSDCCGVLEVKKADASELKKLEKQYNKVLREWSSAFKNVDLAL